MIDRLKAAASTRGKKYMRGVNREIIVKKNNNKLV